MSPDTITTILLFATGALLLVGVDDGVYVVVPAVIAAITGGATSSWLSSRGSRRDGPDPARACLTCSIRAAEARLPG